MSRLVIAPGAAQLLDTPFMTLLRQVLDEVTPVRGLVLVDGPVGTGKTTAVRHVVPQLGIEHTYDQLDARPGSAQIVRILLRQFDSSVPERLPRDETKRRLQLRLAEKNRIVVLDEAHKLDRDAVDQIITLHDHPDANFTLVMCGARVLERLAAFEEFMSRAAIAVPFQRLSGELLLATLNRYHPLLAATDDALLNQLDARHIHGNLRNWAHFTFLAYNRTADLDAGIDAKTAAVCLALMPGMTS